MTQLKSSDVYLISASNTIDHELNKNTERAYNKVIGKGRKPLINRWTLKDKTFVEICYPVTGLNDEQVKDVLDANKQEYCIAITKEGNVRLISSNKVDESNAFTNDFAADIENDKLALNAVIRLLYSVVLDYDKLPPQIQNAIEQELLRREANQKQSDDVLANLEKWYKKGQYYVKQECLEKALEYFDRILESDPTDSVVWGDKGETLAKLQRFEEAVNCYSMAIKTGASTSWILNGKGIAHLYLKEYTNAATCFIFALKSDDKNADTWNNLGIAFDHLQRYNDSVNCFDRSLQIKQNSGVLENKGKLLEKLGMHEEAAKCYDESRRLR